VSASGPSLTGSLTGITIASTGTPTSFSVAAVGGTSQTAGVAFNVTITALDTYGNTEVSYTGSHSITFSGPSNSPAPASTPATYDGSPSPDSITFTSGVGSASVKLYDAQTVTLNAN